MKEARCEPVSGGVVEAGSYVAGRRFGDFHRQSHDIPINSDGVNITMKHEVSSHSHAAAHSSEKRHRPHRDDRKFLMLVDEDGKQKFKACSPTCVDVQWSSVPFRKRIPGFGRKSKDQKTMPKDFIPKDLTVSKRALERNTGHLFPNATSPHIPWKKDAVLYRAVLNTRFNIDFEKCVSHLERQGSRWTEGERCHRIDWDEIPEGQPIAGFGRKGSHSSLGKRIAANETSTDCKECEGAVIEDKDEDDQAPVITMVYGSLLDKSAQAYMVTRKKFGQRPNLWECNVAMKKASEPKMDQGCLPLEDKWKVAAILATPLAIFPNGAPLDAAATSLLFLVTRPLTPLFLLAFEAVVFLGPVMLCWSFFYFWMRKKEKKEEEDDDNMD